MHEDRLALRLVGFSSEDAGFIDNVLSVSPGVQAGLVGTRPTPFDNASQVDEDVNSTTTSGGRAALRWDVTDDVDVTLGALFQDVSSDGHGNINRGVGDFNQVRFSDEGLDDKWYQLALTLNASLPFGDLVVSASYFDRDFRYEADATDYEFRFNRQVACYNAQGEAIVADDTCVDETFVRSTYYLSYDFGGDPHGHATNHEETDITTLEARLQSRNDSQSRWSWLIGAFYSEEKGHTEFDSFVHGYSNTPAFEFFSYYQRYLGGHLAKTNTWFLGRYDTELDQVAVFGELSFDLTDSSRSRRVGAGSTTTASSHSIQEAPEGFSGAIAPRQRAEDERRRNRREAEPDVSLRQGSPRLRDLLRGVPRRRQQPAQGQVTAAQGLRLGQAHELRDRREDGMAGQPPPPQHRRVLHGVGQVRGPGRGSAAECLPARLRQSAQRRDPRRRGRYRLYSHR